MVLIVPLWCRAESFISGSLSRLCLFAWRRQNFFDTRPSSRRLLRFLIIPLLCPFFAQILDGSDVLQQISNLTSTEPSNEREVMPRLEHRVVARGVRVIHSSSRGRVHFLVPFCSFCFDTREASIFSFFYCCHHFSQNRSQKQRSYILHQRAVSVSPELVCLIHPSSMSSGAFYFQIVPVVIPLAGGKFC